MVNMKKIVLEYTKVENKVIFREAGKSMRGDKDTIEIPLNVWLDLFR